MKQQHKELEKIVKQGYRKLDITFDQFSVYENKSKTYRLIYDLGIDRIIVKYAVKK